MFSFSKPQSSSVEHTYIGKTKSRRNIGKDTSEGSLNQGVQGCSKDRTMYNSTISNILRYDFINMTCYSGLPNKKHRRQNTHDKTSYVPNPRETRNPIVRPKVNPYFTKFQSNIESKTRSKKSLDYSGGINVKRKAQKSKYSQLFNQTLNMSGVLRERATYYN